ncbi:MAG: hypothetical protein ABJD24_04510 [Acidimicrobiales bacterium]
MQRKKALTIAATTAIVLGAATAAGATNMGLLRSNRHGPDIGTLTVPTPTTSATDAAVSGAIAAVQPTSTPGHDDATTRVAGTPPVSVEPGSETETESESATAAPSASSSTTVKSTTGSGHEPGADESSDDWSSDHASTSTTVHQGDDHGSGDGGSEHDDD